MIDIPDNILPRDDKGQSICPKCKHQEQDCCCPTFETKTVSKTSFKPVIILDKKGRKGKVVTLITKLPANDNFLKTLSKDLKSQTGSGGTYYIEKKIGIIEIQGDHVQKIKYVINNQTF